MGASGDSAPRKARFIAGRRLSRLAEHVRSLEGERLCHRQVGSARIHWLLLMFASVATCLMGVVLIWRGRWLKRRWLWTLGSLLGFASFGLNWSTGTWTMSFVNVSLLGATATRALPFGPWILTFGISVIAIIVIVRWLRGDRPTESAT